MEAGTISSIFRSRIIDKTSTFPGPPQSVKN
jgi:hypothetical protein